MNDIEVLIVPETDDFTHHISHRNISIVNIQTFLAINYNYYWQLQSFRLKTILVVNKLKRSPNGLLFNFTL
jgi:hypothetical protein